MTQPEIQASPETSPETPSPQYVARIVPNLPAGCPTNITLSVLDGIGRKQYLAEQGFVPIVPAVIPFLKRVHCDGKFTEQGGKGPKLFEILTMEEASQLAAEEEHRMLLGRSGSSSLLHAELRREAMKAEAIAEAKAAEEAAAKREARALAAEARAEAAIAEAKAAEAKAAEIEARASAARTGKKTPR